MRVYRTRDLVLVSLLAAASGVVYTGVGQVWLALTAGTGPIGGAFLGVFQFGHLVAYALIRKPGVAFATSVLSTVTQALIGDPTGIYVLGWGVAHGIGAEAVFAALRYRHWGWMALALAAGVGAILGHLWSFWLYGWQGALFLFWLSIPILFLSSALESGLLAFAIVKAVARSKVWKPEQPRID